MLALLTQSVLDIGFGIMWWTAKKTGSVISYGVGYLWNNEDEAIEKDLIQMGEFREILEENNKKIKELSDKLDAIKEI
jgi:hypothetical protein